MKKIAVMITGGTIGMVTTNGKSRIPAKYLDYPKLFPNIKKIADVSFHNLCYLDSSEVATKEWRLIAEAIHDNLANYDGFVVSHGTDTMAYSAAAISYAFGANPPAPVVFTGSQRTPDLPNSDAERNLSNALRLACSDIREVSIVMGANVWRACRALKISNTADDAFTTPFTAPLAKITASKIKFSSCSPSRSPSSAPSNTPNNTSSNTSGSTSSFIRRAAARPSSFLPYFSDKAILLQAVPGFNIGGLTSIAHKKDWMLAVIIGMGGGNLPDDAMDFIDAAIKQEKHIVLMPVAADIATSSYPPLRKAIKQGAIFANGYTLSGLWTKSSWLLGQSEKNGLQDYTRRNSFLKRQLAKNYVGEIK